MCGGTGRKKASVADADVTDNVVDLGKRTYKKLKRFKELNFMILFRVMKIRKHNP